MFSDFGNIALGVVLVVVGLGGFAVLKLYERKKGK